MKAPIHASVRERFKAFNPLLILQKWLDDIALVHLRQVALFNNEHDNNELLKNLFEKHNSFIGVAFNKGDLHQIYDRFVRIQDALHDAEVETYWDLLLRVDARLAQRYHIVLNDPLWSAKDMYERFKKVDSVYYGPAMETITSSKQILEAQGIPEQELLRDIRQIDRQYSTRQALIELKQRANESADFELTTVLLTEGGKLQILNRKNLGISFLEI